MKQEICLCMGADEGGEGGAVRVVSCSPTRPLPAPAPAPELPEPPEPRLLQGCDSSTPGQEAGFWVSFPSLLRLCSSTPVTAGHLTSCPKMYGASLVPTVPINSVSSRHPSSKWHTRICVLQPDHPREQCNNHHSSCA